MVNIPELKQTFAPTIEESGLAPVDINNAKKPVEISELKQTYAPIAESESGLAPVDISKGKKETIISEFVQTFAPTIEPESIKESPIVLAEDLKAKTEPTIISEFQQTFAPVDPPVYITASEARIMFKEGLNNLTGQVRLLSGTIANKDGTLIITPTGATLTALAAGSMPSIQGWTSTLVFSATDADTVAWATGAITLTDGTIFSITGANTGNMTVLTYIYLDTAVSVTALQTTTTAATAVGAKKILVAVAQNNAGSEATFQVFGGSGGILVKAATRMTITATALTLQA